MRETAAGELKAAMRPRLESQTRASVASGEHTTINNASGHAVPGQARAADSSVHDGPIERPNSALSQSRSSSATAAKPTDDDQTARARAEPLP